MAEEKTKTTAEEIKEETAEKVKEAAAVEEQKEEKSSDKKSKKEARKTKEKPAQEPEQPEQPAEPEVAVSKDAYLRLMAEYDNFRKRSQKEKDDLYGIIRSDTVAKFLPVYDNLERALAAETADEAYRRGVEMIMTQFKQTLEKLGVTEIEGLGKTFDPAFENAVMHVDDEEKGENEVVEVFQKGFMSGDKVIRFAMVKVAN